jgi:galactokinase
MTGAFSARYGREPDAVASAPGRVNLIGEHTDYNGGQVLPIAIPQRTVVALAPRPDRRVRVHTTLGDAEAAFELGAEARTGGFVDYVAGVTWALAAAGHAIGGADLAIASEVPAGGGLSSSAALEIACLRALRDVFALPLDELALARLAHRAESEFVGARVGLMDQLAVALADETRALWLDTHTLAMERVPLPPAAALVVIDSGVRHRLAATGGYNARRAECERAAALLGVPELCRLGLDDLPRVARLPPPLDRRVRHVVTENARVGETVAALRAGDLEAAGQLFLASHASQRDDYEVSVPEVDALVELAWEDPSVHGARLTGGGFGGAVVALARAGRASDVAARTAAAYARATGRTPGVVVPATS